MLYRFKDKTPVIGQNVYIAEGARIIGEVQLEEESSIWYNTVIRADMASIKIGKRTNIQDLSTIHVNRGQPVVIEDEVTVGHSVILHGCTIKKGSLIGMGSIILNGSVIEEETLVAAGSLIPEYKTFPPRVLLMGSPAKVIRELTEKEILSLRDTAGRYVEKANEHRENTPIPQTE
jgi:carbonic anhydrase/acetyltransferase-like protein (isoleucine patch superfamily)